MYYFTITPKDTIETTMAQINAVFGFETLYCFEAPAKLMGNARILTLRKRTNSEIVAKIDGPGFLIEEISEKFR